MKTGFALLLALHVFVVYPRAQDQPLTIPTTEYDQSVYQANAIDRISRDRAYEKTLIAEMIVRAYQNDPNTDPRVLGPQLNELEERYTKQKQLAISANGYQAVGHDALYEAEMFFEIASQMPYLKDVSGIAKKMFEEKVYNINQELAPEAQITAQAQEEKMFAYVQATQGETWSALTKLTSGNAYAVATAEQVERIKKAGKRELMRRGVNQHTLDKICNREPVRATTFTRCLKVLEEVELDGAL